MAGIELVGPSAHDGMHLDFPKAVLAAVIVTRDHDGLLIASLSTRHGADIDRDELGEVLVQIAVKFGESA